VKKIKMFLLFIATFFFVPFMVRAEDANVTINKVSLESKTDGVEITAEPQINGLEINFGLEFSEVGDKVVYKADFINKDNEDYELKLPDSKADGYVTYTYQFSDNSNILKANSNKSLVITVEYKTEVPDSALQGGKYTENNQVKITLLNDNGTVNPKTGQSVLFVFVIGLLLIGTAIVVFRNHKSSKTFALLLAMGVMFLPLSIYALKQLSITVNTKVEIAKIKNFCVLNYAVQPNEPGAQAVDRAAILKMVGSAGNANTISYSYKTGETFLDYIERNSQFVSSTGDSLDSTFDFVSNREEDVCNHNIIIFYTNEELDTMFSSSNTVNNGSEPGTFQGGSDLILDESQGCYYINKYVCGQH